jgi:hypothetical protein
MGKVLPNVKDKEIKSLLFILNFTEKNFNSTKIEFGGDIKFKKDFINDLLYK